MAVISSMSPYQQQDSSFLPNLRLKINVDATILNDSVITSMAEIVGDAVIAKSTDYEVFKNNWSSGRSFTYTKSNAMWCVGCFYGTGQELIEKAYADSETSGQNYERYVNFVEGKI